MSRRTAAALATLLLATACGSNEPVQVALDPTTTTSVLVETTTGELETTTPPAPVTTVPPAPAPTTTPTPAFGPPQRSELDSGDGYTAALEVAIGQPIVVSEAFDGTTAVDEGFFDAFAACSAKFSRGIDENTSVALPISVRLTNTAADFAWRPTVLFPAELPNAQGWLMGTGTSGGGCSDDFRAPGDARDFGALVVVNFSAWEQTGDVHRTTAFIIQQEVINPTNQGQPISEFDGIQLGDAVLRRR